MAATHTAAAGRTVRLADRVRRIDPGGARAVFAAYITVAGAAGAAVAYQVAAAADAAAYAQGCAVYGAVITALALATTHPRTGPRFRLDVATCLAGIALAAAAGFACGSYPPIGQPVLVVLAFVAFYLRRWGEPWSGAGALTLFTFIVHQIVNQFVPAGVLALAAGPVVLVSGIGHLLMPRSIFSRAVRVGGRRLREALAPVLGAAPIDTASAVVAVERIDGLLREIMAEREKAEQFDPAGSAASLAIAHAASVAARVWENTLDGLAAVRDSHEIPEPVRSEIRAARVAVAAALAAPGGDTDEAARRSIDRLSGAVAEMSAHGPVSGAEEANRGIFRLITVQQTLEHLLDASAALDAALAGRTASTPP